MPHFLDILLELITIELLGLLWIFEPLAKLVQ